VQPDSSASIEFDEDEGEEEAPEEVTVVYEEEDPLDSCVFF